MNKTIKALKRIREVLSEPDDEETIAKIREALADHSGDVNEMVAEPAIPEWVDVDDYEEPVMDYERLTALREGEQNRAEDDYFNARPHNDTPTLREMFCQGFDRGFDKGLKYTAPVQPVKQEPVAWYIPDKDLATTDSAWAAENEDMCDPLYRAPLDAKAIRAEERQRCIEAIRKAHDKELCDAYDCIKVIKELE